MGATITSVYTDDQGSYGFYSLAANPYYVVINDQHFSQSTIQATIDPTVRRSHGQIQWTSRGREAASKKASEVPGNHRWRQSQHDRMRANTIHALSRRPRSRSLPRRWTPTGQASSDDAIRHYQKAVQIAPDFYPAHNNLGSDYLSKSDFAASRKEFERVVELNQSDATGYFNLSNVCMLMGALPDAQRFLDEGMRRRSGFPLGRFLLGSLDIHLGKLREAEGILRQAIQLSPVMAQPRLQLMNLYLQQGRKDDAKVELHDFVGAFPDGPFSAQAKQLLQRLEARAQPDAATPK